MTEYYIIMHFLSYCLSVRSHAHIRLWQGGATKFAKRKRKRFAQSNTLMLSGLRPAKERCLDVIEVNL